jgi:hypothetical protein
MEIEIINYIKEAKNHGLSEQEIKQNLLNVGWEAQAVEDSFGYVKLSDTKPKIENFNLANNFSRNFQTPAEPNFEVAQNLPEQHPTMPTLTAFVLEAEPLTQKPLPGKVNQNPHLSLSDQHFLAINDAAAQTAQTPTGPYSKSKLPVAISAIILALALLGIGGYFAYGYFYPSPAKIWGGFLKAQKSKISSSGFNLSYSDPGTLDSSGIAQPFNISLKGTAYSDLSNASSTAFNSDFSVGYKSAEQSGSRNFKLMYLDNNLYLDLSSLTELNALIGQQLSWIKINFDDLKKIASTTPSSSQILGEQQQLQQKMENDLVNALKNRQIITASKLLGSETVNGQNTYHLQNQIDKQALKDIANIILIDSYGSKLAASSSPIDLATAKQELNSTLDKIQLTPFETWIGKKDSQLYKFSIDLKFPGAASYANDSFGGLNPLASGQAKGRDVQRVADMKKMSAALELFYNDHNGYPAAGDLTGTPQGLTTAYISGTIPAAPAADGDCSDYYNAYWYTPTGTAKTTNGLVVYPSYQYTFCLGQDTGGYKAGIAKLTPSGIQSGIVCNDKPENCHKQADVQQQAETAKPATLADLSFEITYSDYGKKQTLTPPADALDIIKFIQDKMQSSFLGSPPMKIPTTTPSH